ncbi:hypothetical protein VSDG_06386 [Cytospora chrysosperma]|uniref:DUF7587 domain-containing protein n=1 Tax=Cytospora chrysosperma TaxID=252740 RepID=A0A423VPJ9_CYTCH|nr:hypothetical protein VSDG_06386 [Valsa sordida]
MAPTAASVDGLIGPMSSLGTSVAAERTFATPLAEIEAFVQSVEQSALLARQVQFNHTRALSEVEEVRSLVSKLVEATRLIDATVDEVQRNIEARSTVQSLVGPEEKPSPIVQGLLAHFDHKITSIARKVLETSKSEDKYTLPRIAEECYKETRSNGQLDPDECQAPFDEAPLSGPHDPDYKCKEYYDHLKCLDLDEGYAKSSADEARIRKGQIWLHYWLQILNTCPGGPTLFSETVCPVGDMPHYLFRVFDHTSTSKSNEHMVASQASICEAVGNRTDLLSLDKQAAVGMLYKHLKWFTFDDPKAPGNLTSWTSSLLYAIQYAIYRCHKDALDPSDVNICVVDTTKFPRGQFARDAHLISELMSYATGIPDVSNFFRFRLENEKYYNGEFLSQGLNSTMQKAGTHGRNEFWSYGRYGLLSSTPPKMSSAQQRRLREGVFKKLP